MRERRGKHVTASKQNNDDFYRIRIIMFLFSHPEATLPKFRENGEYGIGTKGRGPLRRLLDTMVGDEWIRTFPSPHQETIPVYALTKKGEEIANMIRTANDKNPLFDLNAFRNAKLLGMSND